MILKKKNQIEKNFRILVELALVILVLSPFFCGNRKIIEKNGLPIEKNLHIPASSSYNYENNHYLTLDGVNDKLNCFNWSLGKNNFSISFWVRGNEIQNHDSVMIFSALDIQSGNEIYLSSNNKGELDKLKIELYGTASTIILNPVIPINSWTFISVVVTRNKNMTLYINSKLKSSIDISSKSSAGINFDDGLRESKGLCFGDYLGTHENSKYFKGDLDSIGIFQGKSLTSVEITMLYEGFDINTSLICHYNFENIEGNLVYDDSYNNKNGLIVGGTIGLDTNIETTNAGTTNETKNNNNITYTTISSDGRDENSNILNSIYYGIGFSLVILISISSIRFLKKKYDKRKMNSTDSESTNDKSNTVSVKRKLRQDQKILSDFKRVMKLANEIKQSQVAEMLGISEKALSAKLLEWSTQIPFKIKGEMIVVDDISAFMFALDSQFSDWELKEQDKEGKIE
jgi:Concanavalin A-like lectin/glucanases superfamily